MEVLVGFALTALVLGVLFSALYSGTVLKNRLEKSEQAVMARVELQQRLDQVFATLDGTLYMENEPPTLHIAYQNGADPNPMFSGRVEGTIELEKERLILKLPGNPVPKKEVLRKGVSAISYHFLTPANIGMEEVEVWEKSTNYLPHYVKLTLTASGEEESYAFWIRQKLEPIPMKEKK
ncbi:hypothetical protein NEPTK9_001557 [Candidatus Neptunochlamydia vexilliferae]|uniref:General secretion pathway protein GspJ n=2 Tax=Candidatus Neptunichlamydia vexilliferae TaxID=1651774 RepID=A0ABS0B0Y7_9BACT|nr:hypothetical protein [Candidatus Neptunochlamydia vexilliferae]